jgi:hypothetical protein
MQNQLLFFDGKFVEWLHYKKLALFIRPLVLKIHPALPKEREAKR